MYYRSVADLSCLILNNLSKIPKDIDLVVGVPRSGLFVANYISLLLNKPLTDFNGLLERRMISSGRTKNISQNKSRVEDCMKVLIVDDSVASGESISRCKEQLSRSDLNIDIIYCAVYVLPSSIKFIDIFFEILDAPRIFEWNIFHQSKVLEKTCFDMDGVLCDDPLEEENDDGERYVHFIKNALPKVIPTCKIGYIVTSRLEKYREETINWLDKNHIQYGKLVMLDATARERSEKQLYATYKAEFYKHTDSILFIESSHEQAVAINRDTGKPVYCIMTNTFYSGNKIYEFKHKSKLKIRSFFKRFRLIHIMYAKTRKAMKK